MDLAPPVRQPWRLGDRGRAWFDRSIVVVLLLPVPVLAFSDLTYALLATAQSVPLLWRRRRPVAAFLGVGLASGAQVLVMDIPVYTQVAFPIAVYSVSRHAAPRAGAAALLVGLVASAVAALDWLRGYDEDVSLNAFATYAVTVAAFVVTAWALGALARTRRAYVDALVERGERIEREAEQRISLAAAEERARVAREMHDVVAHGLSTIVVQADGARYAAEREPERASVALGTIAATGRESLTEMRRLLGLLRREDGTGRRPQPRLTDIPDLVTGDRVDHRLSGLDLPVADGVALTAYRVVQEALTNVRKHAGPTARATVTLTVAEVVDVEVTDDGRGAAARDGGGLGLLGMRERVEAHDGELEAGPRPGGGFRVHARIPL